MIQARLRGAGPDADACILDASSRGLLAMTAEPPRAGQIVELTVGNHRLVGQVKWSKARRFGLVLRERISVFALASGETGAITLKQRDAARERRARSPSHGATLARRIEYAVLFAAGVAATIVVADYVSIALRTLDPVKLAMAGQHEG